MTTINTIQDLIQLLRDQPDWAEELRGILLSTELRDLPAAVRELAQALTTSTAQANHRLTNIEADTSTLKGDMDRLKGADYEQYVEDKAVHRAYADLGFIQARPVKGPKSGFQPILSVSPGQGPKASGRGSTGHAETD